MNSPQITWYIVEPDNSLVPYDDFYAGSYRPSETVELNLQVWNNRWGQENVQNAVSCRLAIYFDTIEDSALLNLCSVKINNGTTRQLTITAGKGVVDIGTLYGFSNNGTVNTKDNFCSVVLAFGPLPQNMKDGLKNMFVDLQFERQDGGV
jgi:hypothetical protein